jgi:hypothetical protein
MDIKQILLREKIVQGKDRALTTSRSSERPIRIQILLWIVIVFISVTVSSSNFWIYQVGSNNDESRYLILARSLVYADQYGMIHSPGEPIPERYPFGYPLLISLFVRLFPDQIDLPKILSLTATVINIALLFWGWRWFCKSRSYWWGIAIAGLYAVSPVTIEYSRRLMSEAVFMTFCLTTILLVEKVVRERSGHWLTAGMSAALTFVVFIRTLGVVLFVCVLIYLLLKIGKEAWRVIFAVLFQMGILVSLIVAITPVQPGDLLPVAYLNNDKNAGPLVTILSKATELTTEETGLSDGAASQSSSPGWMGKMTTLQQLLTFAVREHLGSDLRAITVPFGESVIRGIVDRFSGSASLWLPIFGYIVSSLVILGLLRLLLQEGLSLFLLFPILYFCALSIWIWNKPRLLYPIQPQIQLAWIIALETILLFAFRVFTRKTSSFHLHQIALTTLTCLLLIASVVKSFREQDSRTHMGDLRARSEWVRTHSLASDVILTEEAQIDYLYSERKTIMFPEGLSTASELKEYLMDNQVSYILDAPNVRWHTVYSPNHSELANQLIPLFEELRKEGLIQLVFSSDADRICVYRVKHMEVTTREY